MKLVSTALAIAMIGAALAAPGLTAQAQTVTINGAGSTFGTPIYTAWGEKARTAIGVQLNYQGIGSGGGQNQIISRTVDFGASDAPVDSPKLKANKLIQFPTVMGGVVPIVNLPGIKADEIKLTGELLANIYLGKITKWNDPKLVELNRGVKLPSYAIAPVYRADGSGTTFIWTSYLSKLSPDWKSSVGADTSVKWPVGNGSKGSDGVAASVKQVRGGIGYVESAYATKNNLITTQLRNKDGVFVKPTIETYTAAADNGDWAGAPDFAIDLIDLHGKTTWPIVSATFILLPTDPKDPAKSAAVMKYFDWAFKDGGGITKELEYIALPAKVQDQVRALWRAQVKAPDGSAVFK